MLNLVALSANHTRLSGCLYIIHTNFCTMRYSLYKFLTGFTFLIIAGAFNKSTAQVNIIENDTTICLGASRTLHALNTTGLPVGTALTVDDIHSNIISLSFPFTFYGNAYTQCVVSTNGFISFNLGRANQFSNWLVAPAGGGVGGPIPGNYDVVNSICGQFSDILPSPTAGLISYTYAGIFPNRKFIVTFSDVPMFACTSLTTSFQMVLFEGSNIIEIHTRTKPICTTWPTPPGVAIEGLQNDLGSSAAVVAGRNYPSVWTVSRDSRRFTPSGINNYTIDSIPYGAIPLAGNTGFTWYTLPNTILGTTNTLTVTPTRTTTYYVRQVAFSDTTFDSVRVIVGGNPQIGSVTPTNPSYCNASDGNLVLHGLDPLVSYDVHYSRNGVSQPGFAANSSVAGDVTIPNLTSGNYNFISVSIGVCAPGNVVGPYTLSNPPIPVDFTSVLKPSCGGIDTVIFTNITPTPGTINYSWTFGDGGTSNLKNPSHVYAAQNVYSVSLTADNGFCQDSIRKNIDTRHPLHANFYVDYDTACIGQVLNFHDTSTFVTGTAAPTYFWDFGDGTTGTGNAPIHSYTASGLYHVRMVITDFVPCTDTARKDIYVNVTPVTTFTTNPSSLCEGQGSVFTGNFAGVVPKSYEWTFSDGTIIYNQNPINHAFDSSGIYNIKLSTHYDFCPDTFFATDVAVHPYPNVNLGPDTSLCPGSESIVLRDLVYTNGGAQYAWNTGSVAPSINVSVDGIYSATKTVDGCAATDSITILKSCYLDIPNSFTPNGDGINDYFLPRSLLSRGATTYKMSVYNRWGQLIFESTSLNGRGWDGTFNDKAQPQGAYVYIIDVSFINGHREHYTGNVTLIR